MLLLFLHPSNNRTPPKMVFSHQSIYPRSGVDRNSRWLLEFPGLDGVQALLTTDMDTMGCGDMCVLVSGEKADLAIACEFFLFPLPAVIKRGRIARQKGRAVIGQRTLVPRRQWSPVAKEEETTASRIPISSPTMVLARRYTI